MKRDMELVRKILLEIEKRTDGQKSGIYKESFSIEGYKDDLLTYHVKLIYEAGLIHANLERDSMGYWYFIDCLTWEGHDFLEFARNDNIWNKSIDYIKKKGSALTIEILKYTLPIIAKNQLGF